MESLPYAVSNDSSNLVVYAPTLNKVHSSVAKLTLWSSLFVALIFLFFYRSPSSSSNNPPSSDPSRRYLASATWGGAAWEKRVRTSARIRSRNGFSVLVTGAAGFVGTHVSSALKTPRRWSQAGVRYAMQNPGSYVHSNIAGFVSLLEVCKDANPQPAIVWASSSSVMGLILKCLSPGKIELINLLGFTYIDDIVKGCLGSLDTAEKSTGSGGKKKGPAQLRVFNLGNTSPVPVTDLVGILERLLKVKAKRNV
ncbi:hypothetical protein POTOM_061939 [Populus tomentosa]|uniref:NAD-dependent epimerase/dehydratase domain-containing protein n=1 Tax=Populus tomentosa TaxID=118781 RepID=A0A8X7XPY4_POPTO|nr:hypothetical protein POTOM_061939 [Populus tomentosa]